MKRLTAGISLLVPVAAGAVRWLDLVNFCDLTTGFVLLGPVWARYLCMAMVLSLGVLASFLAARRPSGLVRRSMSLGLLCLLAGGAFAALAGVQLAALLGGAEADVLETAQTVLYLLTALWLLLLGISRVAGSTVAPSGSAWTGILGTFAFYLLTVRRFCFNPSGIVRIVPTVQVFRCCFRGRSRRSTCRIFRLGGGCSSGGIWRFSSAPVWKRRRRCACIWVANIPWPSWRKGWPSA